jgi:hypothetical protein
MQVLENFLVRPKHTRLVIGNSMLLTKGFDEALCFLQAVSGHAWEQVMLDLVVQSSIPEIRHGVPFHIASRYDLAVQEAQVALFAYHGHPLMIGSKDRSQVQTREQLMHHHEQDGLPDSQEEEQQAQVSPKVKHHECHFNGVILLFLEDQEAKTGGLQAERNQRQHGKKEDRLMFENKLVDLSFFEKIFPGHGEDRHIEIRIEVMLVRMTVVSIMLAHPPPVAHPNEQVARQKTNEIVFPRLPKDLPMSSIMTKQPKLRGDQSQIDGIEKLKPKRAYQDQEDDAQDKETQ